MVILYISATYCNDITYKSSSMLISPPMGRQPLVGQDFPRRHDHTQPHHTRYDSSGRLMNPTQRPLSDYTQHPQQTAMPRRVLGAQSQQARDRAATGVASMSVTPTTCGYIAPDLTGLLLTGVASTDRGYVATHTDCQHSQRLPSSPHLHHNPTSLTANGKRLFTPG